jgi:NAD(P)-dependent dehydrogenase (short-subunit alcohol dehydrogenase family)
MSLAGKVVVVTGGARGTGREYVRGFLKEGAMVVATDRSWTPSGESADDEDFFSEVKDNPNVLATVMDITLDSHVNRVFKETMAKFGTVDVIINNGGIRTRDLYPYPNRVNILDTEVSDWQKMFDTHAFGTLRVIKAFTPPMLEKRSGSIINVVSGGFTSAGTSQEGPYQPAKAAQMCMSLYLAHELKPYNIAVNMVTPGPVRTTGSDEQEASREVLAISRGQEWNPRVRMRPESVVPLALHLAEQDASGVTGQRISATQFLQEHELGGWEVWGYEPDVEAAKAAGRLE